ncbi:hypothetical protein MUO79_06960 [Candidatus Bathyarchaeota archaeon]|nr:hypothetical protein [Candidatus Bathyarchaeota archaeon]
MPWDEGEDYIRSGHRNPDDFQSDSMRTITISEEEGIKAVIGKPKGKDTTEVQSYLFDKAKGWTVEKAKAWFEKHGEATREHVYAVLPFKVLEKIVDKPLRIRGVAMTAGMSRNFNIYTSEELQAFASKLVGSPVYIEHVSVGNAVGKTTKTEWDGQSLWYEAEIYDDETAEKIRKGLVQHVSVGADYEAIDVVDGMVPHGLHDAELSLVAVPGIPETNVQVLEKLREGSMSPAGASAGQGTPSGIENMNEKELEKLVDDKVKAALKEQGEQDNTSKLTEAEKTIEQLKKQLPGSGLIKDPPKTVPIVEAITILEGLLPSPVVENSTMGMKRECQEIRRAIFQLKEKVKSG